MVPAKKLRRKGAKAAAGRKASGAASPRDGGEKNQAEVLLEFVRGCEIFLDPMGTSYIALKQPDHIEVHPVRSTGLRRHLTYTYESRTDRTPSPDAVRRAIETLDARTAKKGTRRCDVEIRVGGDDRQIVIDLCDDSWRAAIITADGWRLGPHPVPMRRTKGMRELPVPRKGGTIDLLRPFVNLDDDEFLLLIAWILASLRKRGPYPIAALTGEYGSAKSTLAKIAGALIGPTVPALRSLPKDPRDLAVAATNNWLLNFENVSSVGLEMSDALCRIATGAGHATRSLYTDSEEALFDVCRPIILNGITEYLKQGDLIDRSISFHLLQIEKYRTEQDFWGSFGEAHPLILGALYDLAAIALRVIPSISRDELSRMSDFCLWGEAVGVAMGGSPGEFLDIYGGNRDAIKKDLAEGSPVGRVLVEFLSRAISCGSSGWTEDRPWRGSGYELLTAMNQLASDEVRALPTWPKTGNGLTAALRKLAPDLRRLGHHFADRRDRTTRWVEVWSNHPPEMLQISLDGLGEA